MQTIKAARSIRIRYLVALGLIAALVSGSYLSMQRIIAQQRDFSELIDLAGGQSGLANRIAYFGLLMITSNNALAFDTAQAQLGRSITKIRQGIRHCCRERRSQSVA